MRLERVESFEELLLVYEWLDLGYRQAEVATLAGDKTSEALCGHANDV